MYVQTLFNLRPDILKGRMVMIIPTIRNRKKDGLIKKEKMKNSMRNRILLFSMLLLVAMLASACASGSRPAQSTTDSVAPSASTFSDANAPSVEQTLSDGTATEADQYLTDPVPEGKPLPVEPGTVETNDSVTHSCSFLIECRTIADNLDDLADGKLEVLPEDYVIFPETEVEFSEGESVFDVLQRICRENGIHMESSFTPIYNSAYIEGICNLYEFDCGSLSGWMYRVNDWYPNYGCSRYMLMDGDKVEWRYTCDLGEDIGGGFGGV